jgi:hydrogenase maturation protease
MLDQAHKIAVIGCGNPNRSDDGAGCEVVRVLRSRAMFDEAQVHLLDAGTDGMGVMFAARGCVSLIVIDACRTGSPAGAIFEVPGTELEAQHRPALTLHDFRWDHALFAGRRMFGEQFPNRVTVILIEAATLDLGIGLSPSVAEAAGNVASRVHALVKAQLESIGCMS